MFNANMMAVAYQLTKLKRLLLEWDRLCNMNGSSSRSDKEGGFLSNNVCKSEKKQNKNKISAIVPFLTFGISNGLHFIFVIANTSSIWMNVKLRNGLDKCLIGKFIRLICFESIELTQKAKVRHIDEWNYNTSNPLTVEMVKFS